MKLQDVYRYVVSNGPQIASMLTAKQLINGNDDETINGIGDEFASMAYYPGTFSPESVIQCRTMLFGSDEDPIVVTLSIGYINDNPRKVISLTYMSKLIDARDVSGDIDDIHRTLTAMVNMCTYLIK